MMLKYKVEGEDERKKQIWDQKMNQREISVLYDYLVVFIRHDLAEIRVLVVVAPRQSRDFNIF